jgi:hypothetical protein
MSIKGMTDNVVPRFPRLGKLRKGGERIKKVKNGREYFTFGKDLDHFRFTSEHGNQDIAAVFRSAFGDAPRVVQVYLPYKTPAENFPTWCEIWDASGLVHRCDGETMTLWREGPKLVSGTKPCAGGHKDGDYRNDAVGRLSVIIPELIEAGHVGYVVMETHGKNDCANITSVLQAVYDTTPRQDLRGIAFNLRRSLENISVPGWGERSEQRSRADKWLVRIEPVADWTRLALEAAKQSALQLQEPRMTNPPDDAIAGDFEPVEDTNFDEPHEGEDDDEPEAEPEATQPAQPDNDTPAVDEKLVACLKMKTATGKELASLSREQRTELHSKLIALSPEKITEAIIALDEALVYINEHTAPERQGELFADPLIQAALDMGGRIVEGPADD